MSSQHLVCLNNLRGWRQQCQRSCDVTFLTTLATVKCEEIVLSIRESDFYKFNCYDLEMSIEIICNLILQKE